VKPRTPAINAITKNVIDQLNMASILLFKNFYTLLLKA
jgi:hypothetical protein